MMLLHIIKLTNKDSFGLILSFNYKVIMEHLHEKRNCRILAILMISIVVVVFSIFQPSAKCGS